MHGPATTASEGLPQPLHAPAQPSPSPPPQLHSLTSSGSQRVPQSAALSSSSTHKKPSGVGSTAERTLRDIVNGDLASARDAHELSNDRAAAEDPAQSLQPAPDASKQSLRPATSSAPAPDAPAAEVSNAVQSSSMQTRCATACRHPAGAEQELSSAKLPGKGHPAAHANMNTLAAAHDARQESDICSGIAAVDTDALEAELVRLEAAFEGSADAEPAAARCASLRRLSLVARSASACQLSRAVVDE